MGCIRQRLIISLVALSLRITWTIMNGERKQYAESSTTSICA